MKKFFIFLLVLLILVSGMSCKDDKEITWTEDDLDPEKILAGIPVYPDAVMTTEEESGFKPFSTPLALQPLIAHPQYFYETVSEQYITEAEPEKIRRWYTDYFKSKGYQLYSQTSYSGPETGDTRSLCYYPPNNPLLSFEVHICDNPDHTLFALIVNLDTESSLEPPVPVIPDDITSISVTYITDEGTMIKKVIIEEHDIEKIIEIINTLPRQLYGPPVRTGELKIEMILRSESKENIYGKLYSDGGSLRLSGGKEVIDSESMLIKTIKTMIDID